jgi:hypothetical protein
LVRKIPNPVPVIVPVLRLVTPPPSLSMTPTAPDAMEPALVTVPAASLR